MTDSSIDNADWLREMVDKANANAARISDMTDVRTLLNRNDVVIAVWPDPTASHGVGHLVIKGDSYLLTAMLTQTSLRLRVDAIKCVEEAQAVALKQLHGDPPPVVLQ